MIKKSEWDKRAHKYRKRGLSGLGRRIALTEWTAAAGLWNKWIAHVDGWTVDFGAGNGGFWDLVEKPADLLLVDISSGLFENADEQRIVADALNPPFRTASINCIVALGLLEYFKDPVKAFSQWRNIMVDGGKMILSNSPPLFQNKLRKMARLGVFPRTDEEIIKALRISGWIIYPESQVHAGWQSLFVAQASISPD